jgi:hypothetical protein
MIEINELTYPISWNQIMIEEGIYDCTPHKQ